MSDSSKSSVVQYDNSVKQPVVSFNELAVNTNLNLAPSGWLQGKFAEKAPFAPSQSSKPKALSSLSIANSFVDHVGKVDVITDAENVKKLLKMTYSDAPVSLIVHRVGKTLLIDSFDAYRNFLFAKEQQWQWLRKFLSDTLDHNTNMSIIPAKALSRQDLEARLMLSKFLYHSMNDDEPGENSKMSHNVPGTVPLNSPIVDPLVSKADLADMKDSFERDVLWNFEDIRMLIGTDLPIFGAGTHPCVTLRLRDMKKPISILTGIDYWLDQLMSAVPEVVMCYHLNGIVQKYEVLKTEDLPNVPGSSFSPDLVRDVAQNILSFLKSNATKEGHTYWLFKDKDDDIVKLYDLTSVCQEYMDEMSANPFTLPVAVLMYRVARNLLQKVTKSKKTLPKTVYRLLTHCLELLDTKKFPQVVGSVHYCLANLYMSCGCKSGEDFLNCCVDESKNGTNDGGESKPEDDVDEWEYEDLYVSDPSSRILTVHPTNTGAVNNNTSSSTPACMTLNDLMTNQPETRLANLSATPNTKPGAIPFGSNMEDCWQSALEHILKGLQCLDLNSVDDQCKEEIITSKKEEEELATPDGRPIPLRYESISKTALNLVPLSVRLPNSTDWRLNLTRLLLLRAMKLYELLSDFAFKLEHYGKALRYIKQSFLCCDAGRQLMADQVDEEKSDPAVMECRRLITSVIPSLLTLCGDTHCMLGHINSTGLDKHIRDFNANSYRDDKIGTKAKSICRSNHDEQGYSWCWEMCSSTEQSFQLSQRAYEEALKLIQTPGESRMEIKESFNTNNKNDKCGKMSSFRRERIDETVVYKRLGNVKNALGIYFMNLSSAILSQKDETKTKTAENCWSISYMYFQDGIQIFNKQNDKDNEALLNSNAGRLMRLCASTRMDLDAPFNMEEEHYLTRAVEMYQRALECVNPKNSTHKVWESVAWELSSVYFNFAVNLQERPPLLRKSLEDIERDIIELMQKSLRLVESLMATDEAKRAVYVFRIAVIHHKLASLYYKLSVSKDDLTERKLKQTRSLSELHYRKASDGFKETVIESPAEFIGVQIERAVFVESAVDAQANYTSKIKTYNQALEMLITCRCAFLSLGRKVCRENSPKKAKNKSKIADKTETSIECESNPTLDQCGTLCDLALHRIRSICKSALMVSRSMQSGDSTGQKWKHLYSIALSLEPKDIFQMPKHVLGVLEKLQGSM